MAARARAREIRAPPDGDAVYGNSQPLELPAQLSVSDTVDENNAGLSSAFCSRVAGFPFDYAELVPPAAAAKIEQLGISAYTVLDATWISEASQGDYKYVPGSLSYLKMVVLDPKTNTVAIYCERHREWLVSPIQHMSKKHPGDHFSPDLFRNYVIV